MTRYNPFRWCVAVLGGMVIYTLQLPVIVFLMLFNVIHWWLNILDEKFVVVSNTYLIRLREWAKEKDNECDARKV